MPRHRLLAFHPGAHAESAGDDPGWLVLEPPSQLDLELDPTEAHDLMVGLAARFGDRYLRLVSDTWEDLVPAEIGGAEITVRLASEGRAPPEVAFVR